MSVAHPTCVLIVDDDVLVLETIQDILEQLGYTVVGSGVNGLEAIELTRTLRPDILLMDIRMPRLDGIAAARQIQEQHPTPVVMLTAHDDPELIGQARDAGVVAYLVKPPDAATVARTIPIALARFEDMLELRRLNAALQHVCMDVLDVDRPDTTGVPPAKVDRIHAGPGQMARVRPQEDQRRVHPLS